MRVVAAAVIVAFLCGPAFGQAQQPVPQYGDMGKDKTPGQKETEREAEKAYRRSLGNIPEQKVNDPWGTVRSDKPADKSADKPAAPKKPKTGTSTGTSATKSGTTAN
jgi:hypothetical protein